MIGCLNIIDFEVFQESVCFFVQCCCKKECFVKQHPYTFDNKKIQFLFLWVERNV